MGLNLAYLTLRVPRGDLPRALTALETIGAVGANLTMPLKSEVLPLLSSCTAAARAIGAVNSLRRVESHCPDLQHAEDEATPRASGWEGENTDWLGWLDSWDSEIAEPLEGRKAIVLGAGGAAKAIVYALHARQIGSVAVMRRQWTDTHQWLPGFSIRALDFSQTTLEAELEPGCVIINSTPIGTWPNSEGRSPLGWPPRLPAGCVACDLIYNPTRTLWLEQAAKAGARILGGMGMLVHQAARAVTWWSGATVPPELVKASEKTPNP